MCTMMYLLIFIGLICHVQGGGSKVKLQDVETITLRHDEMTTARRGSRIAQLTCVGGSAFKYTLGYPKVVQCYNRGFDGTDVQWECKADMNTNLKFGKLEVSCEGYDYPSDPYILKGSCGLEYELDYVDSGRSSEQHRHFSGKKLPEEDPPSGSALFMVICLVAAMAGIYFFCLSPSIGDSTERRPPPPPGFRPPGGGGGNDDDYPPRGPPPAYDSSYPDSNTYRRTNPSAPPFTSTPSYGWDTGVTGCCSGSRTQTQTEAPSRTAAPPRTPNDSQSGGWTSFLGGGALGGLLGYMLGARQQPRQPGYIPGVADAGGWGGWGGWGGGGGGGRGWFSGSRDWFDTPTASGYTARPVSTSRWGGSSSRSPSPTTTRTASGFGGTKRR